MCAIVNNYEKLFLGEFKIFASILNTELSLLINIYNVIFIWVHFFEKVSENPTKNLIFRATSFLGFKFQYNKIIFLLSLINFDPLIGNFLAL